MEGSNGSIPTDIYISYEDKSRGSIEDIIQTGTVTTDELSMSASDTDVVYETPYMSEIPASLLGVIGVTAYDTITDSYLPVKAFYKIPFNAKFGVIVTNPDGGQHSVVIEVTYTYIPKL